MHWMGTLQSMWITIIVLSVTSVLIHLLLTVNTTRVHRESMIIARNSKIHARDRNWKAPKLCRCSNLDVDIRINFLDSIKISALHYKDIQPIIEISSLPKSQIRFS
jgi:hypothetical protein